MSKLVELGGGEFLGELVETFLADTPSRLDEAAVAVQKGDWVAVERVCHSLASSAAMLGATGLAALGRELEHAMVAGDRHEISQRLTRLREVYESYVPCLREECRRLASG